jgi:hypothetical protein
MRNMRTKLIGSLSAALILGGLPLFTACDKTKSEHEVEVKHPDGTVDTHVDQTVQKPDGSIKTESKTETSKPAP